MSHKNVRYLVFDIESIADGDLISKTRYPGEGLNGVQAISAYRKYLQEKYESDFIPYTFQIPISIVVAKVAEDYSLLDVVSLDDIDYRPHMMTEHFWRGWEKYGRPTLVSFNGRTFDIPLLELAAFRYGIGIHQWFRFRDRSFEQPRNRYNLDGHFDLHEVLTNFGASRFNGGLNLAANLIGKPGKIDVQGFMVQDLYDAGKLKEIDAYCRCDVLDTYFVFLRCLVMIGELSLEQEQQLVGKTKDWLIDQSTTHAIYKTYLNAWGDWESPWGSA